MEISTGVGLLILYILGLLGWAIIRPLRIPVPAFIGSLLAIGGLRAAGYGLPDAPAPFFEVLQMSLGFYVGNLITKETLRGIRKVFVPAGVTMVWVVVLAFAGGAVLSVLTFLDPLTGILASSTGGLPEMTVIAVSTYADASIMIILQVVRIFVVVIGFPILLQYLKSHSNKGRDAEDSFSVQLDDPAPQGNIKDFLVSGSMALIGGIIFLRLNIPAGAMVGAILFVVVGTVLGYIFQFQSRRALDLLLVGVGIMAADSITPDVGRLLLSGGLVYPILLSTAVTLLSSFLLAGVLTRISKWDYLTCMMAAAPAGLTVMTALAVQYKKDPVPVFMIHICRVIILKTAIPIILMFFL